MNFFFLVNQKDKNLFNAQRQFFPVLRHVVRQPINQLCPNSEVLKLHKPTSVAVKKQLEQLQVKLNEVIYFFI
jgi:hypothetical protein